MSLFVFQNKLYTKFGKRLPPRDIPTRLLLAEVHLTSAMAAHALQRSQLIGNFTNHLSSACVMVNHSVLATLKARSHGYLALPTSNKLQATTGNNTPIQEKFEGSV